MRTALESRLSARLTPQASSNAVMRYADGVLFLRLTALPIEGPANAACCAFVVELLGVRRLQVTISQGHKRRDKVLTITGVSGAVVGERLQLALPTS